MKKQFFLLIFLWVIILPFFGNNYYEKGYIVSLKKDTIQGFIERISESKMSKKILFKKDMSDTPITYFPDSILSFGFIQDQIVFSSVVYTERVSLSFSGSEQVKTPSFAKYLLMADFNLYKLQLSFLEDDYVYIVQKGNNYYTIRPDIDKMDQFTSKIHKKDIGVLIYLLQPCAEEVKKVENTPFDDEAFIKLFLQYSTCAAPDVKQSVFKYKNKIQYTFIPEIGYTGIFIDDIYYDGYAAEFFCKIYAPALSENTSLMLGLKYSYYKNDLDTGWKRGADRIVFSIMGSYNVYKQERKHAIDLLAGPNFSFWSTDGVSYALDFGISYQFTKIRLSGIYESIFPLAQEVNAKAFFITTGYCF